MNTIHFKGKSTEELIRKSKQLKTYAVLGIIAGVAVLCAGIYDIVVHKKFSPLIVVAFLLGVMVMVNAKRIKEIGKELKAR